MGWELQLDKGESSDPAGQTEVFQASFIPYKQLLGERNASTQRAWWLGEKGRQPDWHKVEAALIPGTCFKADISLPSSPHQS